ncbi:MAG: glycosyltransferase family 4 protein [Bacteroidota bacterium]|nr:glycosyltransferase family 4 protein [Bacteroidota bacterium]
MNEVKTPKVVCITNIPSPYRVYLFNKIVERGKIDLTAIYCAKIQDERKWNVNNLNHKHIFLNTQALAFVHKYFYINTEIWEKLNSINPDIVVTAGIVPTMLIAWFWAFIKGKKRGLATDSWALTDKNLSKTNKIIKKFIYRNSNIFYPVSEKGKMNFMSYGVPESNIYKVGYAIDNKYYSSFKDTEKKYDIMFSGQFIDRKNPVFFCEVASELKRMRGKIKVLIIGSGEMEREIIEFFKKNSIDYEFPGFISPERIPEYYAASRLLLFTTREDAWGVIANEALAVGVPVITTPFAGAAEELVIDNFNGYIMDFDVMLWAKQINDLLDNDEEYKRLSNNALSHIDNFSGDIASENFENAIFKSINDIEK